jgi:hypothetical protein
VDQLIRDTIEVVRDLDVVVDIKCGRPHSTSSVALLLMWLSARADA